jgi:hypothetical protein
MSTHDDTAPADEELTLRDVINHVSFALGDISSKMVTKSDLECNLKRLATKDQVAALHQAIDEVKELLAVLKEDFTEVGEDIYQQKFRINPHLDQRLSRLEGRAKLRPIPVPAEE